MKLGLTDIERNALERRRRARNCAVALLAVILIGRALVELI